jgi:hypothetical protein
VHVQHSPDDCQSGLRHHQHTSTCWYQQRNASNGTVPPWVGKKCTPVINITRNWSGRLLGGRFRPLLLLSLYFDLWKISLQCTAGQSLIMWSGPSWLLLQPPWWGQQGPSRVSQPDFTGKGKWKVWQVRVAVMLPANVRHRKHTAQCQHCQSLVHIDNDNATYCATSATPIMGKVSNTGNQDSSNGKHHSSSPDSTATSARPRTVKSCDT